MGTGTGTSAKFVQWNSHLLITRNCILTEANSDLTTVWSVRDTRIEGSNIGHLPNTCAINFLPTTCTCRHELHINARRATLCAFSTSAHSQLQRRGSAYQKRECRTRVSAEFLTKRKSAYHGFERLKYSCKFSCRMCFRDSFLSLWRHERL